jgi:hypothetical protein
VSTHQSRGRHRAVLERPAPSRHARPAGGRHARPGSRVRHRLLVVTAGTVLFGGGGAATAAWVAHGSGDADAMALSAQSVVVDNEAEPVADLYPGGTGDVVLRVRNPNPYAVTLTTVQYGTVIGGCAAGSVVPVQATVTLAPPIQLAANSTVQTVTFPDVVRMVPTAPNDCQRAAFTGPVTLTGTSA